MASNDPEEGRAASNGGHPCAALSFRSGGADHPAHTKARPDLSDSYIYYAELLLAVDGHSLSVPRPRASLDDLRPDFAGSQSREATVVRFDDTWT